MTIGKPVFAYIQEEYLPYFPGLPIINTKKEEIFQELKFFLDNPQELAEISIKSREYVEKFHDSRKVAEELEKVYLQLEKPIKTTKSQIKKFY